MSETEKPTFITIRVPAELKARVERAAQSRQQHPSKFVRQALIAVLGALERTGKPNGGTTP